MHPEEYPLQTHYMISHMRVDPRYKAKRRRQIRESLPAPLNEIPLRHVERVHALPERQQAILAAVLARLGVRCLGNCLTILKSSSVAIESEDDLIERLQRARKPYHGKRGSPEGTADDRDHLATLLRTCYPDMPESTAQALAASDVMLASLSVVTSTRQALEEATSDFVVTALYTLLEERLHALEQILNSNPAFAKAIQRSRPDWNIKR